MACDQEACKNFDLMVRIIGAILAIAVITIGLAIV